MRWCGSFAAIRRQLNPDQVAGLVSAHVQQHIASLPQANAYQVVAAVNDLVAQLSKPTHRTSTVHLPSGSVKMDVTETR
jgi:hypothetical protein